MRPRQSAAAAIHGKRTAAVVRARPVMLMAGAGVNACAMPNCENQTSDATTYRLRSAASRSRTNAARRQPSAHMPAVVPPVVAASRARIPPAISESTWRASGRRRPALHLVERRQDLGAALGAVGGRVRPQREPVGALGGGHPAGSGAAIAIRETTTAAAERRRAASASSAFPPAGVRR